MPLAELMSQIHDFPKIDKLRLMQFFATELVKEEDANLLGTKSILSVRPTIALRLPMF